MMAAMGLDGIDLIFATPQRGAVSLTPEETKVLDWFNNSAYLDLGHVCNQSCRYCWQAGEERHQTPYDMVLHHLSLSRKARIEKIILIGGEPLLYPHLKELISAMRANNMPRWGLMSNGILLSDEARLATLVENGLAYCQISFDSPYPDVQNGLAQNPKLFDSLMRTFENMSHFPDLALDFNAVVTRENADHLPELVRFVDELRQRYAISPVLAMTQMKPLSGLGDVELRMSDIEASDTLIPALEEAERLALPLFIRNMPKRLLGKYADRLADCLLGIVRLLPDGTIIQPDSNGCDPVPESWWLSRIKPIKQVEKNSEFVSLIAMAGSLIEPVARDVDSLLAELIPGDIRPIIIAGAEAVRHPQLPDLVARLNKTGRDVWLESSGLAFTSQKRLIRLKNTGLKGLRLLHLPLDHMTYLTLIGGPLNRAVRQHILKQCSSSGLDVKHVVPVQQKSIETLMDFLNDLLGLIPEKESVEVIDSASGSCGAFCFGTINAKELNRLHHELKKRLPERVIIRF